MPPTQAVRNVYGESRLPDSALHVHKTDDFHCSLETLFAAGILEAYHQIERWTLRRVILTVGDEIAVPYETELVVELRAGE